MKLVEDSLRAQGVEVERVGTKCQAILTSPWFDEYCFHREHHKAVRS